MTLHQGHNDQLWDDNLEEESGVSDEEKIDIAVGKVVNALPGLKSLQFGKYFFVPNEQWTAQWGKSLRWMGIVEQRYRDRKRTLRENEEKDAKKEMMELNQYMWKEGGNGQTWWERRTWRPTG